MGVFDDVKAIEDYEIAGAGEQARGERMANAGREAVKRAMAMRDDVESGKVSLEMAASQAREATLLLSAIESMRSDPPKRGRGPDRKPRQRKSSASEAPAEETKPVPSGNEAVLLAAFKDGPLTRAGIEAITGWTQSAIQDAIDAATQVTTWVMKRDGDSEPVAVWGTKEQCSAYTNSIPLQARGKASDAPR